MRDTAKVFKSPLAEWQKLDSYHRFRLTFVFQVIFPGSTWCKNLDTALRAIVKQGLSLPRRTCTHYFYLPQSLGGLGIPIAEDEAHVARAAQALKFLGDTRDTLIRAVALINWQRQCPKGQNTWIPLTGVTWQNSSTPLPIPEKVMLGTSIACGALPGASLAVGGAILHTNSHHITWQQRKRAFQVMKEAVGARHLSAVRCSKDQGRAFNSLSLHPDSTFFTYISAFISFSD